MLRTSHIISAPLKLGRSRTHRERDSNGSRYAQQAMVDFIESLASAITVRQMTTPIEQALIFTPSAIRSEVRAALDERNFDFAPVANGDRVIGRIGRIDIDRASTESLDAVVTPLHDRIIVSAGSPIDRVVEWFINEPFLLVLEGRDVVGLVTVSDLNKQAARTYLYAMVAGFEMALANLLRLRAKDQNQLLRGLSEDRQLRVRDDFAAAGDQEADYIAAMTLSDLLEAVRGCGASKELGFASRNAWERETGSLVSFRNRVAHTTRPVVKSNADIAEVKDAIDSLKDLYNRATAASLAGDPAKR